MEIPSCALVHYSLLPLRTTMDNRLRQRTTMDNRWWQLCRPGLVFLGMQRMEGIWKVLSWYGGSKPNCHMMNDHIQSIWSWALRLLEVVKTQASHSPMTEPTNLSTTRKTRGARLLHLRNPLMGWLWIPSSDLRSVEVCYNGKGNFFFYAWICFSWIWYAICTGC